MNSIISCLDQVDELHTCRHALLSVPPVPLFVIDSEARSHHAIDDTVSHDRIIVEFGGFPSNGSRFFGIIRQDAVQDIVNVRESPVSRFWTG